MGEYYKWVNVDKREYISPNDFDYGNKRRESMAIGTELLRALRDLLASEWRGDHILWMGDEVTLETDAENNALHSLYMQSAEMGYRGDIVAPVDEYYTNVSGLYIAAETEVRAEITLFLRDQNGPAPDMNNEYGIDIANPYEGLFTRAGRDFKYTINRTRRSCYSFENTRIIHQDGSEWVNADPLPMLMICGKNSGIGPWVGDIIDVADEMPDGCELLSEIQLDW